MNDSHFLHHEACPKCKSRDNVGVYSDGHKYCFGCGWFWQGYTTSVYQLPVKNSDVELPKDVSMILPESVATHLKSFGITTEEISNYGIRYSHMMERLIFPEYEPNTGKLVFWTGKYMGSMIDKPKYYSRGNRDNLLCLIGTPEKVESDHIVVVEDKISAIKVGRQFYTCPLYGSYLGLQLTTRLAKLFNHLTIWLDYDKIKTAYQLQKNYAQFFDTIYVCNTVKDPKEYDDVQIKDLVEYFNTSKPESAL